MLLVLPHQQMLLPQEMAVELVALLGVHWVPELGEVEPAQRVPEPGEVALVLQVLELVEEVLLAPELLLERQALQPLTEEDLVPELAAEAV